ncbi:MAG: hypothetical protein EKK64_03455 [Neisseriaceae bacterium]|nr:MAG: hypothetical protein EKK64_03455 [Neisseriaceae bacterium]
MSENKSDKKILALLEEIKSQTEEISKAESRPVWKTTCRFSVDGPDTQGGELNLHVENNISKLIYIASFLREKERAYNETSKLLKVLKAPAFMWGGFPVSDWLEDIQTKINKVQINEKKKKLDSLQKRLVQITSQELKAKMELDLIEEELNQ